MTGATLAASLVEPASIAARSIRKLLCSISCCHTSRFGAAAFTRGGSRAAWRSSASTPTTRAAERSFVRFLAASPLARALATTGCFTSWTPGAFRTSRLFLRTRPRRCLATRAAPYVEVVASRLRRNFAGAPLGADIVIASDLPGASGMSSSSALVIAIASALARVGALDRRPEWRENIAGPREVAGYYACIENGLSFGSLSGDAGVGTHGGSEDHAAILTGVPGRLAAFAFVPMRALAVVPVPDRWRFVLTPCGVAAQKTGAARDAYNLLAGGIQVLLDLWNRDSPAAAPSLGAALSNSGDSALDVAAPAADRLRALVRRSAVPGWSGDALEKRLNHFIREDARIPQAVDGFRHADEGRIGQLAEASQADAETLLGNQIPETSALVRTARDLGAFASSSFGAGFGGSVWALVDEDRADAFARRWHPEAFIALPGPPVVELSATENSLGFTGVRRKESVFCLNHTLPIGTV